MAAAGVFLGVLAILTDNAVLAAGPRRRDVRVRSRPSNPRPEQGRRPRQDRADELPGRRTAAPSRPRARASRTGTIGRDRLGSRVLGRRTRRLPAPARDRAADGRRPLRRLAGSPRFFFFFFCLPFCSNKAARPPRTYELAPGDVLLAVQTAQALSRPKQLWALWGSLHTATRSAAPALARATRSSSPLHVNAAAWQPVTVTVAAGAARLNERGRTARRLGRWAGFVGETTHVGRRGRRARARLARSS